MNESYKIKKIKIKKHYFKQKIILKINLTKFNLDLKWLK